MKKLALDVDSLAVESFATDADGEAPRGTVQGREWRPTVGSVCYSLLGSNPTCCPCTP